MASEIVKSIQFICEEKGLDYTVVLEALESALGAAYRKDFGNRQQNIQVKYDPETGYMKVWDEKLVVIDIAVEELEQAQNELNERREQARKENRELSDEEVADLAQFNPKSEIMVTEARVTKSDAQVGETLIIQF